MEAPREAALDASMEHPALTPQGAPKRRGALRQRFAVPDGVIRRHCAINNYAVSR